MAEPAADPALDTRVARLAAELRCLVCQNQTIAESNAELANDLKRLIREQLAAGKTDREVLDFMAARYGDFVLYRPPLKPSTALLWGAPALLVAAGGAALWFTLKRRQRLPAEAFDAEDNTPADEPHR
jgi:cytochrome c-type biogenesis protein CcmH